jgi:hypothetical protein
MRNTFLLLGSLALTVLGWGFYGPVLRAGQIGMSTEGGIATLRPFVCLGLAYFLIAVIAPVLWLHFRGEQGEWTLRGIAWSFAGGSLGAIGAFAIILASVFGGRPIWVMPLVFGGAPVVNAFLTIVMARRIKEIGPLFLAALIIVIIGVCVVLIAAPHAAPKVAPQVDASSNQADAASAAPTPASAVAQSGFWAWTRRLLAVALAVLSWGAYGPVLHRGQAAMHHSRMRAFICVGLAYNVIAIIVPYFFLGEMGEASTYVSWGTLWSLIAGAIAAIGALGIIMAFHFGGRPVFVMPLVFGLAPVVNTFVAISSHGSWSRINPFFWAGLILVIAGAVMVLVLAPREKGQETRVKSQEPEVEVGGRKEEGGAEGVPTT